jgi:superfamily II DNA helicase RecQ
VILHDRTLEEIARRKPRTKGELAGVSGIGPLRLDGYGDEILAVVERHL